MLGAYECRRVYLVLFAGHTHFSMYIFGMYEVGCNMGCTG